MAPSWKVCRHGFDQSCGDYSVEVSKIGTPCGSNPRIKVQYHELIVDIGSESFYEDVMMWRRGRSIPCRARLVRLLESANVPFYINRNCAVDLILEALNHIFKDHALHLVRLGSLRSRRRCSMPLPSVLVSISSLQNFTIRDIQEEDCENPMFWNHLIL